MKLGCSTVLFNQLDLYGALKHIAWAGYEGAELACLGQWARHVELITKKSYIDEIKATAKKHNLALFGIHAGFGDQPGYDRITGMKIMFEVAEKIGIPIVTIRCGGKSDDKKSTKEEFQIIREMSKAAESHGVTLAIKPHVGASVYNTATMLQMLNEIDSPALGANLDTLHIFRAREDASETVRKLGKKIVHVHLREYPDVPDRLHYEALAEEEIAGRGGVEFPKILKALKKIGYEGAMDLDVIGAFTFPLSRQMGITAESRGYFNRCMQELK